MAIGKYFKPAIAAAPVAPTLALQKANGIASAQPTMKTLRRPKAI